MFVAMNDGRVKGMLCVGQNPATSLNARLERAAMRKLEWLVVKDNWLHETATFWKNAPEMKSGEIKPEDIKTEVFFFPSAQVAETEGTFTNTQRMLQSHFKAAEAPGDCRTDVWFTYQLGKRVKKLYAESQAPRDEGFRNLVFDYEHEDAHERQRGEPSATALLKEMNGYYSADPGRHIAGFADLKDDGTTTCASWIYSGVFPAPDKNRAASKQPDPPGELGAQLEWGWAWPANRRILYNRASADLQGRPWSERKKWVWWDEAQKKWIGYDVPDFAATKAPSAKAKPGAIGLDAHGGSDPFIMKADGHGWLFVPTGLVDGPLPTHYEPAESPVANPLYKQQSSPVLKYWKRSDNPLAPLGDARFPYVITTYRLTEHYLSGAMSRWLPWLTELQPELFVEMSPELAGEKGIRNLDRAWVITPRARVQAKALVTRRLRPLQVDGKIIHHVGMPLHWGYEGVVTGDVVNELSALVGDPNVTIHEGKAFVCNVRRREPGVACPSRWASSPTRRSASAARPARSPATSGTSCPATNGGRRHVLSGDSYDNTRPARRYALAARQVHRAVHPRPDRRPLADDVRRLQALRQRAAAWRSARPARSSAPSSTRCTSRPRLQRLPRLHRGLPVRRHRHQPGDEHRAEVHVLLRPAPERPDAGLRAGLPDRVDPVRPDRRAQDPRGEARGSAAPRARARSARISTAPTTRCSAA